MATTQQYQEVCEVLDAKFAAVKEAMRDYEYALSQTGVNLALPQRDGQVFFGESSTINSLTNALGNMHGQFVQARYHVGLEIAKEESK